MDIAERIISDIFNSGLSPERITISVPLYRRLLACGAPEIRQSPPGGLQGVLTIHGIPTWLSDDLGAPGYRLVYARARRKG